MVEKYITIELNDPRAGAIAEALSNKTAKKMLEIMSDKEMSVTEISQALSVPLNTTDYNVKKLLAAGLIMKTSAVHWSIKGKRIPRYKLANTKILIAPRSMIRGIMPSAIIAGLLALSIRLYASAHSAITQTIQQASESSGSTAAAGIVDKVSGIIAQPPISQPETLLQTCQQLILSSNSWLWFLLGALIALALVLLWNWRKI